MELAGKQLRRFRCKDMAQHVNAKSSDVHHVLQRWVKHGKVRKVGVTYFYEEAR
jgi:hypothetical protein